MLYVIISKLKEWLTSRMIPIVLVYFALAGVLIFQMYRIQILDAKQVVAEEEYKLIRERQTDSTRGMIYDRNGRVLAYNELSYSVILEDSPLLNTNDKKNAMLYHLIQILEREKVELEPEFYITLGESGILEYTVDGTARLRFIKNALGKQSIDNLTEEERNLSAEELFALLRYGNLKFGSMYGISDEYSVEDALQIMSVRYAIFTLWPKYSQITLATGVSDTLISALKENSAELPGISVVQKTKRVYNYSEYFAHIIGYTGKITEEELEDYNAEEEIFSATDVIGKTGLEKTFEDVLNGKKGVEKLTLDGNYRIVNTEVEEEPQAGNNLYLTIDAEMQKAYYHLVEKELAKILLEQMTEELDYGTKGESADEILIPVYEVYDALFSNNVLNVNRIFGDTPPEDAGANELKVYQKYQNKYQTVLNRLDGYLAYGSTTTNAKLSEEMAAYMEYIYTKLSSANVGILLTSKIDKSDEIYLGYKNNTVSLSEFLVHAINRNWIDFGKLGIETYYVTDEIYQILQDKIFELLKEDATFAKKLLRNMIFQKELSGKEVCLLLFDQNVIKYNEADYKALSNGRVSAYTFIREKIGNIEITPAQLALEPCGASLIVTDVNTGDVLALVTYPSYDNNKLANKIDWEYYSKLLADKSNPLSSRITNSKTTTGSTFKMITSFAGYGENELGLYETIDDLGEFTKVDPSPKCWYYPRKHGKIDVSKAIYHSCNYFYFEVGYRLAEDYNGKYSDSLGIAKLRKYAEKFGLGANSGIEIAELEPQIASHDAVRAAIGYYHSFTPSQIARYATTLANRGICYNLTLIDRIMDTKEQLVLENSATILNEITEFTDAEWAQVQKGMYLVLNSSDSTGRQYSSLGVAAAGKSGTAQVSDTKPSHVLFVSYAPYVNPEIAVTVVIPNGYSSGNAVDFGYVVYDYYFHPETYDTSYNKLEEE
ncbi:MAG: penicillin-binding transpeptidase domain-containing protein [Lachnospiraceae bacterium]|nr:penicillin-binding transpeptidase domain-containing protein [Lachnospiraceae bacterium]